MKTVHTILVLILCGLVILPGCAKKPKTDTAAAPPAAAAAPVNSAVPTEAIVEEAITPPAGNEKGTGTEFPSLADDRLETIYFDFDSFTLSGDARAKLERNARRLLQAAPAGRITIEGHTDERGSDAYNLALGEKRARAAMAYLHHLGVAGERMTVISYGEERPAESGQDEEAWSKNRRAEFM